MLNESRIDIYDYLYNLFYDVVTKNVYSMREPQELTKADTTDGFIVIRVGDLIDASEFSRQAYGEVRCYVQAFVPPSSRGRLDYEKYKVFEDGINTAISLAIEAEGNGGYSIQEDNILSSDAEETSTANNSYFTFIKSFIVIIDEQE